MGWRIAIVGAFAATFAASPPAAAVDLTECALMLEDDAARLACYDRVVMAEIKRLKEIKAAGEPVVTPPPSDKTAEELWADKPYVPALAVAPSPAAPRVVAAPKTFKRIDVSDVMATPSKWAHRDIEFASANVYWVGDDDLRILTSINMTLFGRAATGDATELAYLKENCETAKEAQSAKCKVRVRFAYTDHSEDRPNGYAKRTVLVAPTVELVRLLGGRKRR